MKVSTQKYKAKSFDIAKNVGIFSSSLFVAASAVYLYSPVIATHANTNANTEADVNLRIRETMSLNLSTESLDLTTAPNNFVANYLTVSATTNSQYGYTLTIEDTDSDTKLVHFDDSITDNLTSTFEGSKTRTELEENTWGFSLNLNNFYKIPANGSPVALKRTSTIMTASGEQTDVGFGAKVGNISSGIYSDDILFTIYVNGQDGKPMNPDDPDNPPADPVDEIYASDFGPIGPVGDMQDMTPEMCNSFRLHESRLLLDTRDNNAYRVTKLMDGQCWMTENLKISGITLNSTTSDLAAGTTFTLPASSRSSFTDMENYDAAHVYIDDTYGYGGYYNFYAATAGTGGSSAGVDEEATSSICPKGWRLPHSSMYESDFITLYEQYDEIAGNMVRDPVSFAYNGYLTYDYHNGLNGTAAYWASNHNSTQAFSLDIYKDSISAIHYTPTQIRDKNYGIGVRCIARGN